MSPRNHSFPVSCARQDMNVGTVFTFLINAFNFDNRGCAAAALLDIYLQLMCWKEDDTTCCCTRTGQQAKVDLVYASHRAFFSFIPGKLKGRARIFLQPVWKGRGAESSTATTGQHQQLWCAPVSLQAPAGSFLFLWDPSGLTQLRSSLGHRPGSAALLRFKLQSSIS